MTSSEIRKKYLEFFEKKGHKVVPSASLVPENDPTTLFTSAGMQPMIPYLLGESHPEGKRIVDSQKCFRAQDIMEVGDNRHTTFFEMLGNWSFGDYFKREQLGWLWDFLTTELRLDPNKLYVSVFEGYKQIPKDQESIEIWQELFSQKEIKAEVGERIFTYGPDKNWWARAASPEDMPVGEPGGPDSEVFYEFTQVEHDPKFGEKCHPNCDCGRFLEIANSVFMQYQKLEDGTFKELPQKNVDFGGGLERLAAATNNQPDVFKNDLHWGIIEKVLTETGVNYEDHPTSLRVIADHIKAAIFLIKDGVTPSNKMQGYVLRRLLRRSAVKLHTLKPDSLELLPKLVDPVIDIYEGTNYFQQGDWDNIRQVITEEVRKFQQLLNSSLPLANKIIEGYLDQYRKEGKWLPFGKAAAKDAFNLYQSHGVNEEMFIDLFSEKLQREFTGFVYPDEEIAQIKNEFGKLLEEHQTISKAGSEELFQK